LGKGGFLAAGAAPLCSAAVPHAHTGHGPDHSSHRLPGVRVEGVVPPADAAPACAFLPFPSLPPASFWTASTSPASASACSSASTSRCTSRRWAAGAGACSRLASLAAPQRDSWRCCCAARWPPSHLCRRFHSRLPPESHVRRFPFFPCPAAQRENHIGLIDTKCSPAGVCQDAIDDARSICMREKGSAPDVTVYGEPSFTFPYVPSHLHHMVRGRRRGAAQLRVCSCALSLARPAAVGGSC
jgi:hypothetical protein